MNLTNFKNTHVEGTIQCDRDGVLYTSIPQNGNWHATVDGEPAQIVLIGDTMCGLLLSPGEHSVSFTYRNKAFTLGLVVSFLCLAAVALLYWFLYKPGRKKGRYERH